MTATNRGKTPSNKAATGSSGKTPGDAYVVSLGFIPGVGRPVVVTTEHKGVFFGYVQDETKSPNQITLTGVRNCVYWPESVKGFLGLAVSGPTKGSKVGPAATVSTLFKLTGVFDCSPAAVAAWEAAAWG